MYRLLGVLLKGILGLYMREKARTCIRLKHTGSLFYVVLRIGVNSGGIEGEGVKE